MHMTQLRGMRKNHILKYALLYPYHLKMIVLNWTSVQAADGIKKGTWSKQQYHFEKWFKRSQLHPGQLVSVQFILLLILILNPVTSINVTL